MSAKIQSLAMAALLSCCAVQAQSPVDSLLQEFRTQPLDSLRWLALFQISQYYARENADSALAWAQYGLDFARQSKPSLIPRSLNNVGLQYMNKGNFDRAMEYYLLTIESARQYNCLPCIATTTGNMGIIAWNKKEYDKAERYFREAITLMQALKDTVGQARYLNNLGLVQTDKSNLQEAEQIFNTALRLLDAADTICFQPTIYSNLGNLAYARGDFPQALEFYQQSFALAEKIHDEAAAFLGMNNAGWVYLAMKNYDEAIGCFSRSKQLAERVKNEKHVGVALGALSEAYKAKGDFPNAFAYLEQYLQVHDTINARLNNKAVMELETRYQTQQQEIRIARQQLQLANATRQKWSILGGALVAVLSVLGFYQYFSNRQRLRQREAEHSLQLEQAEAGKLRELDRVKSSFFANISHEFRTPLTLILGPLQKWLGGTPHLASGQEQAPIEPAEIKIPAKDLHTIRRSAGRLLELVNQLLDLSKLESGRMRLSAARGDVPQTLRVLANAFESMAEQSGIRYQILIPETSALGWFDRDKLEKIAGNLLANAFKHTPEGGTVSIRAELRDERLHLAVEDTGQGIPAAALDKIFERFYQVEGTGDKGTGIGLALVKELVALHHGQISVESQLGMGSVFRVELPLSWGAFAADELTEMPPPALEKDFSGQTGQRAVTTAPETAAADQFETQHVPLCLVVEDNPELQTFIREQLAGQFRVLLAANGREGLATALETIPDLIISDVMMPEMDGNALCAALKTDERTSHIPIILLTARAGQESRLAGLETGADDYLTKPFDTRELLVRAQNLVDQRARLRRQFSRTVVLKPKEIALTSADERFLQRIQDTLDARLSEEQFSVEDLAAAVGMSRSQLHRKLTALIDQPPVEFIRNFRLRRAKEMLEAGTGNVSEIGFEVGFGSPAYFSKAFKDAFGVSPSEVRKG